MTAETEDRVLTQVELAKRWNLTTRTLQNWFKEGKGPKRMMIGIKPGYRLIDVLKYEEEITEEPGTQREKNQLKHVFPEEHRQLGAEARKAKAKAKAKP
jgi:hypothetical protein